VIGWSVCEHSQRVLVSLPPSLTPTSVSAVSASSVHWVASSTRQRQATEGGELCFGDLGSLLPALTPGGALGWPSHATGGSKASSPTPNCPLKTRKGTAEKTSNFLALSECGRGGRSPVVPERQRARSPHLRGSGEASTLRPIGSRPCLPYPVPNLSLSSSPPTAQLPRSDSYSSINTVTHSG